MSAEWRVVRISDLGRVVTGRTPPGNDPDYYGSAVPFLTPSDMEEHRQVNSTARSLSALGATELGRCLVPQGVGVSCIGWQMGKAVLINRPTVTNQQINSIIVNECVADRSFVYYSLRSRRNELFNLGSGGSRTPILNKGDFERLTFALPSIPEQQAVVSILGAFDDKIDLNRRMNETLEELARTVFKSWFVDLDPVRAKAEGRPPVGMDAETAALFPSRFVESELGEIPEEWQAGQLKDLLVLQRGFDLPANNRVPGRFPIVAASGPTEGHAEFKARGPGVVTGRSGLLGRVFLVLNDFWPLNTTLWVKDFKVAGPFYAYQVLQRLDLATFNAGSAVPTLNRNHIHTLPHVLPPRTVVTAYETTVEPLLRRCLHNHQEALTLAELRDLLLPKLISGELRVPEAEKLAEAVL